MALGLLTLPAACGVKGDLQPKGKPDPQPATNLEIRQQADTVLLNWDIPTKNQDDTELTDLAGFRIGVYSYQPESFCAECRDQEVLATIEVDNPYPARVFGRTYYLRSAAISTERGFRYRVVPFTESGKLAPPADIRLTIWQAPAAPVNVKVEQLDRGAKLFWALSGDIQQSGELVGVNIYRGLAKEALDPEPINPAPVKGNNYDDFSLTNGITYQYGIRSVVSIDGSIVESALSTIVTATPQAGL